MLAKLAAAGAAGLHSFTLCLPDLCAPATAGRYADAIILEDIMKVLRHAGLVKIMNFQAHDVVSEQKPRLLRYDFKNGRTAFFQQPVIASWLAVCCLAVPAAAHHSSAPHYDLSQSIAVTGVVSKFELVNPHAYVYFISTDAAGKQAQWRCELSAKGFLVRMGWRDDTFKVGEKLIFKGSPARREENVCVLNSFVRSDGTEIDARANLLTGQRGRVEIKVAQLPVRNSAATIAATSHFSGNWVAQSNGPGAAAGGVGMGGSGGGMQGGRPAMPQATAAGQQAARQYDQRFDDPGVKCSPANILFGWTHDQHVNEISQSGKTITLRYGYMDLLRTIHLDQSAHPAKSVATLAGHSIGHWETNSGKTELVVDTVGFQAGVLVPMAGILHSTQLQVVERFSLDGTGNILTRSYQVQDPLYLQSGYSGADVMLRTDEPYSPYNCVELSGKNNQRS